MPDFQNQMFKAYPATVRVVTEEQLAAQRDSAPPGAIFRREGLSENANLAAELASSPSIARQPFVVGGQSNAESKGSADTNPPFLPTHPNVWMIDKGGVYRRAVEPLSERVSGWVSNIPEGKNPPAPLYSFGIPMGRVVSQVCGVSPLLIPCAVGSTNLDEWANPGGTLSMSTLFGALILRAQDAMTRTGLQPVFVWFGHEGNKADSTVDYATGVVTNDYLWKWVRLIRDVRAYFPNAPFLFCQLSTDNEVADAGMACVTGEVQRKSAFAGGELVRFVDTTVPPVPYLADANNTITFVSPNVVRMISDGAVNLNFKYENVLVSGTPCDLSMTVTGTGRFRVYASAQIGGIYDVGTHNLTFTTTAPTLTITRGNSGEACDLTFTFNYIRQANSGQIENTFMAVTHDVQRNTSADSIHLANAGLRDVGHRMALAYAEKVLKLPGIDGTGPRLVSVTSTDATHTKVKFTQAIAAAKAGETNYGDGTDSLFRVYDGGVEKSVTTVAIDGSDSTALIITHASCSGVRVVSYGNRPGQNGTVRKGVVYNTATIPLPAPQFLQAAV